MTDKIADSVEEIVYTTFDKTGWGEGRWQNEPDKIQFTDEATGLPCLIVRNVWTGDERQSGSGALCGYVGVPEGHPFFGVRYACDAPVPINHTCDEPWCRPSPEHVLDVHGGITYSDSCQEGPEDQTICHIPAENEPDTVWWLGFDTSHCSDYAPLHEHIMEKYRNDRWPRTMAYRDVKYVKSECARLAAQLKEV